MIAIADAIRAKNGGAATYKPSQMAAGINALVTLSEGSADATAAAEDILSGKSAYVGGSKITGSIASKAAATITPSTTDQTIAAGQYLSGVQTIAGDANLVAGNIKSGVSIFGIAGTHAGGGGGPSGLANCLRFISLSEFTLDANGGQTWDGTLEWTNGTADWATWDGTTTLSSNGGFLALRGTGNTAITGGGFDAWELTGSNIACEGNIETLLDYATVVSGGHPTMDNYCYSFMFHGCTALTTAPALPATTLADGCYYQMFGGCTSLTTPPTLPATTLAESCYQHMFRGCTSLTKIPALPATTLADYCYYGMFQECTALKLSAASTSEYVYPWRIPARSTWNTATDPLVNMFTGTGGTFTGTPDMYTTYYTTNPPVS